MEMVLVSAVASAPHPRWKRSTELNGGGDADDRGGGEDGSDASLSASASRLGARTLCEQSNASAPLLYCRVYFFAFLGQSVEEILGRISHVLRYQSEKN